MALSVTLPDVQWLKESKQRTIKNEEVAFIYCKIITWHFHERSEKKHENLKQDSQQRNRIRTGVPLNESQKRYHWVQIDLCF